MKLGFNTPGKGRRGLDKYFDLFSNHDHTAGPLFDIKENVLSTLLEKHPKLFEDKPEDIIMALQDSQQELTENKVFVLNRLPIMIRLGGLARVNTRKILPRTS